MASPAPFQAPDAGPFAGGGEMGGRIAGYPWDSSPLGPIAGWSPALLNTVSLILPAEAQIVVFWGPEHVAIYNDSYIAAIGINHPGALGRPAIEHWAELWDDLEPLLRRVMETGETFSARDRSFYVERKGFGEEVFFDVSYSAVREADGRVGGVMCIVSETTDRVRAQRGMMAENERLARLFEAAPSFMCVMRGPEHVFELANPAYRRLVGHRDVIGLPVRDALPDIAGQGYYELLDEIYRTGRTYKGRDARVSFQATPDCPVEQRYIDFVYQPIFDSTGKVTGIFTVGHDITAEYENRRRLGWSEESLRLATEAAEIGKWDYDVETDQLDWSDRTKAMFGIAPGAPYSLADFYAGLHPEDRDATSTAFARALDPARRETYDVEYRTIGRDDGIIRWVAAKGRGVFDEHGRCVRAIGTAIDITARRQQEEELRESEARFRSLADSAPALIWISNSQDGVIFVNQWSKPLLGYEPEELLGHDWPRLFEPEDLKKFRIDDPRFVASGRGSSGDIRMIARDGRRLWVHLEASPRIIDGEHKGFVGVGFDVTESHDAAVALERAVKARTSELALANRELLNQISEREKVEATLTQMQRLEAVGQLTSGVAHDFNNLLTVVLGNLDMLERRGADALDARSRERLNHMRTAAERGATLTAQLLAFSRRTRLATNAVDLNDTVSAMRPLLESTLGGTVAITTDLADNLWLAEVDATQIELAILNLAINARDAMDVGGQLTISTGNATMAQKDGPGAPPAGEHVMVCVRDDGTGMPPDVAARAFEPFFTTKAVGKGSGLGLAQVYGFARQSGGGVTIETAPGQGTTVCIFLPRARTVATTVRDDGPLPSSTPPSGACALVVDDDDAVRDVTADKLRRLGYSVMEADSGRAALALLRDHRIDLVVADFAMPGMNGAELIRRIGRSHPTLPTMIVTGYADLGAVSHLGDERIVQKPFRAEELERKVAMLMSSPG